MRLFPVWQFAHEGTYQSVYEALLGVKSALGICSAAGP